MHRVGAAPADVAALVARIAAAAPAVRLRGMFTHLAVADEPENPYTAAQLAAFDAVLDVVLDGLPADASRRPRSCTPATRQVRSPIPTPGGRSCAPASRCTASLPARMSPT